MIKVTTIGGGTGTFNVLSGLKNYPDIHLTAIVTVSDSGGSTGRLRDEFGFLPVGDLRQSLAALADETDHHWIRKLLLYRFDNGSGITGHNLGNLILTALQDMTGSTPKAIELAGKVFRLKGKIYPVTTKSVHLVVKYSNGETIIGEHNISPKHHGGLKITSVSLKPSAQIYSKAKLAILESDFIIIGPGDLYDSILPNLIVQGTQQAINNSKAKVIYITNLMTRYTQTHNFTATDHVNTVKKYLGIYPDYVIINTSKIPPKILKAYKKENEHPVKNDLRPGNYQVISAPLSSISTTKQLSSDTIKRSLLRHDEDKLAKLLQKLFSSQLK